MLEKAPQDIPWAGYLTEVWGYMAGVSDEDRVVEAYAGLDGRPAKAKARSLLDDAIGHAVEEGNDEGAKRLVELRTRLKNRNWRKSKLPPRKESKLSQYLEHAGALQIAFGIVATEIPDDVAGLLDPNWLTALPTDNSRALLYRRWLLDDPDTRGPEPDVFEIDKRAARVSLGRAPGAAGRPPVIRSRRS